MVALDASISDTHTHTHTHTDNKRGSGIVIEEVPAYTQSFNDTLLHEGRTCAHWPDASAHTAWELLDELGPHSRCHNLGRDRHVFGSYVTGHLPREHLHVADTIHDDRAEEGVFLGNDLATLTF